MNETVNMAADQGAAAGSAVESAPEFAFAPEPAAQPAAGQATQPAGQKDAGAVDAQRSADTRGIEPRKDFTQNRFTRQQPQKDIGKAFDKESDRVRTQEERKYAEKLEADPYRVVAKRLVTDLMRSKGITEEQALQELDNGFYAAIAEREGISPAIARMLYAQQQQAAQAQSPVQEAKQIQNQDQQQQPAAYSVTDEANAIMEELASIDIPEGFDLDAAIDDIAFTELLHEHPAASAIKIYQLQQQASSASQAAANAPQVLADKLRARAEVPQSSRSSAAVGPPNFHGMTREQYRQYQKDNNLI
jgi:hypothetical protein